MASRYGGITGSAEISQDYENINIAFENVEADVDAKAQIVTDHINDNVRHVTEAEHTKLASIQNGAEPNQNAFTQVNDVVATSETDTITIEGGTGITVTTNPTQKKVVLTATGEATPGPHGPSHNIDGSDPIPDLDNLRNDLDTLEGDFTAHLADETAHVYYGADTGTANAKVVTLNPAPAAYVEGMAVAFKNAVQNTGAVTININGLGEKSILKSTGSALASGNLKANSIYTLRYNGLGFILQGEGGGGTATANDIRLGKTATVDTGDVTGALVTRAAGPTTITPTASDQVLQAGIYDGAITIKAAPGIKHASGTGYYVFVTGNEYRLTVTGLDFLPGMVAIQESDPSNPAVGAYVNKDGVSLNLYTSGSTVNQSRFTRTANGFTVTGFNRSTTAPVSWTASE